MIDTQADRAVVVVAGPDCELAERACEIVRSQGWTSVRARTMSELLDPASPTVCGLREPEAAAVVVCEDGVAGDDWKAVARLARAERLAPLFLAFSHEGTTRSTHGLFLASCADELADAVRSRIRGSFGGGEFRFSAADFLASEVARARRLETPVSVAYLSISHIGNQEQIEPKWIEDLAHAVKRALRETDALVQSGDGMIVVLPFTPSDALETVETRLHDSVRPVLRQIRGATGADWKLGIGSCNFPDEARDWAELIDTARSRARQDISADAEQAA